MVEVCSPARGSVPRDSHPRPWGRRCGSGDLVLNRPSRAIGIGQCVPAFPFQLSSPFLPPPHSRRAVGDGGESGARDRHAVDWPYRSLFFPSPAPPLLFRPSSQPLRLPLREGARAECPGLNGAGWQREGGEVTGRHALNSPSPRAGWVRRALPHRSPVLGWRGQSRGCQGIHRERERKKKPCPICSWIDLGWVFPPSLWMATRVPHGTSARRLPCHSVAGCRYLLMGGGLPTSPLLPSYPSPPRGMRQVGGRGGKGRTSTYRWSQAEGGDLIQPDRRRPSDWQKGVGRASVLRYILPPIPGGEGLVTAFSARSAHPTGGV